MGEDAEKSDDERLAEILAAIDLSVRDWIGELEDEARALETAPSSEEAERALHAVREISHNIGGSAGTLGFTTIGDAALPLELKCASVIDGGGEPRAEERRAIMDLVRRVTRAAEEALPSAVD